MLVLSHRPATLDFSLRQIAMEVDSGFDRLLAVPGDSRARLYDAMRHAAIGGGKRLRPLLLMASAALFDVPPARAFRAGLAVECVHVQSLIHDDLPCMDDDDLRRGRLTVHRAFDEATAVLAGDALHALAFEILADGATHPDAAVRAELAAGLARAAGAGGMAGGQMLDLLPGAANGDLAAIARLQGLKTGALIGWSVDAGAALGSALPEERAGLRDFADCLGFAFQIADDLLDVGGCEATVGKRVGKDAGAGKGTIVALLGVDAAREQARRLCERAADHLDLFGDRADLLKAIAAFAIDRDR